MQLLQICWLKISLSCTVSHKLNIFTFRILDKLYVIASLILDVRTVKLLTKEIALSIEVIEVQPNFRAEPSAIKFKHLVINLLKLRNQEKYSYLSVTISVLLSATSNMFERRRNASICNNI